MSAAEWYGYVTDVDGDMFTAVLRREGEQDVLADFSAAECGLSGVEAGRYIVVTPDSVRWLELPVWTQEQLDAIRERARRRSRALGFDDRAAS